MCAVGKHVVKYMLYVPSLHTLPALPMGPIQYAAKGDVSRLLAKLLGYKCLKAPRLRAVRRKGQSPGPQLAVAAAFDC